MEMEMEMEEKGKKSFSILHVKNGLVFFNVWNFGKLPLQDLNYVVLYGKVNNDGWKQWIYTKSCYEDQTMYFLEGLGGVNIGDFQYNNFFVVIEEIESNFITPHKRRKFIGGIIQGLYDNLLYYENSRSPDFVRRSFRKKIESLYDDYTKISFCKYVLHKLIDKWEPKNHSEVKSIVEDVSKVALTFRNSSEISRDIQKFHVTKKNNL